MVRQPLPFASRALIRSSWLPRPCPASRRNCDGSGSDLGVQHRLNYGYGLRMSAKLLIAAGEAAATPKELPASIHGLIDAADEILVVAPRLPGRLDWLTSATDKASEQADERLQEVLGHLNELGAEASGRVGADDPLLAFEDAIREFAPDHILIALRGSDRGGWQERGLLDSILNRFEVPMTVFVLPPG